MWCAFGVGIMSNNEHPFKEKIRTAFELAEKHSWLFYVIVLVLLVPIKFGYIDAQKELIDIVITISLISITAQAIKKIKNKDNDSKPYISCMKCKNKIESTGVWTCKNIVNGKECGWSSTFPDN